MPRQRKKNPCITPVTLKNGKVKYVVQISKFSKTLYVGRFDKLTEARIKRDLARAS